jgi:hypothetical protein
VVVAAYGDGVADRIEAAAMANTKPAIGSKQRPNRIEQVTNGSTA